MWQPIRTRRGALRHSYRLTSYKCSCCFQLSLSPARTYVTGQQGTKGQLSVHFGLVVSFDKDDDDGGDINENADAQFTC